MLEFAEFRIEHGPIVMTGIERRGYGTPIVLLHGAGGNALCFKPMLSALGTRPVIALDMPGHGGSTDAPSWEMEPLAELVYSMSRRLVKERAIWGGHSWGGKLAAMIAAMHPETRRSPADRSVARRRHHDPRRVVRGRHVRGRAGTVGLIGKSFQHGEQLAAIHQLERRPGTRFRTRPGSRR